jgi:Icc protein
MRIRIAQISDMHLNLEGQLAFGVDGGQQFLSVLEAACALSPHAIILTGDFCFDEPVAEVYPWVKKHMELCDIPYYAISGNHDDAVLLANTFHPRFLKERELFYQKRIGEHFIVFLDSTKGKFSSAQWLWLEKQLDTDLAYVHIVMHHPPVYAGTPHMDNHHAFIDQERFVQLMARQNRPVHIYCGHYHMARYVQHKNIHIHIAPSTLFQMNPDTFDFELQSTRPGFQVIDLDRHRVVTSIHWLSIDES